MLTLTEDVKDMPLTALKPNKVGGLLDPVNIQVMDVPKFIAEHKALAVSSSLVFEPSTTHYHEEGLYSEDIFGPVGSPERMDRFGYIDLNTMVFSPKIFKIIVQLKSLYKDIMSGAAYAVFNDVTKDFDRVIGNPLDTPGANTGYSFFLHHFNELQFDRKTSRRRDDRIGVLEMYKDVSIFVRYLVEPAGLRDLTNDSSGRLVQDDVNKLYTSLLLYTRSIPKGSTSPLYDTVRYQIQSKAQEIYEYIENFLDGKRGFIQGAFARRNIALGTRNVITAPPLLATSPEDPQLLKTDDFMIGVYQTTKGLMPYTKHAYMTIFGNPIFKYEAGTKVALSDPKTGELVYTSISPSTRDKWMSSDGIDKLINSQRNVDLRKKPVLIPDIDGKKYALAFIYDEGDEIALCRSIDDLKARWPRPIQKSKLRPITYIEMFYIIAEVISTGRHGIVTRYPVIEQGSCYVGRIHVVSTSPSRYVELIDMLSHENSNIPLRQYPILGSSYMDAIMPHPTRLGAMGADFDGDETY